MYESKTGRTSAGHRGHVPATISSDYSKHANLPTDAYIIDYPMNEFLEQFVGDSIIVADQTQDGGVRSLRRQSTTEKY